MGSSRTRTRKMVWSFNLPNWKLLTQYPDPEKTDELHWAWEFLRRNPRFQQDWKYELSLLDEFDEVPMEHPDFEIIPDVHEGSKGRNYFLDKYRIYTLPNPNNPDPRHLTFERRYGGVYEQKRKIFGSVKVPLFKHQAAVIFDLRLPLKQQLEKANLKLKARVRELKAQSIRKRKAGSHKWRTYLRLLDARASGESQSNMADVIYVDKRGKSCFENRIDLVKKSLKAARRLRDSDFQRIAIGTL